MTARGRVCRDLGIDGFIAAKRPGVRNTWSFTTREAGTVVVSNTRAGHRRTYLCFEKIGETSSWRGLPVTRGEIAGPTTGRRPEWPAEWWGHGTP